MLKAACLLLFPISVVCFVSLFLAPSPILAQYNFPKIHGTYLKYLSQIEGFSSPQGLWYDSYRDEIYVADTDDHAVKAFAPDGTLQLVIGEREGIQAPLSVAVTKEQDIYVSELHTGEVKIFDFQGKKKGRLNLQDARAGALYLDKRGYLWILDRKWLQVLKLTSEGELQNKFPVSRKTAQSAPTYLALDEARNILVTDGMEKSVTKYDPEGNLITSIENVQGRPEPMFSFPASLAIDWEGRLWVLDGLQQRLKLFDPSLKFLQNIGKYGTDPGQLFFPVAMAIDEKNRRMFVLEKGTGRLQIFVVRN